MQQSSEVLSIENESIYCSDLERKSLSVTLHSVHCTLYPCISPGILGLNPLTPARVPRNRYYNGRVAYPAAYVFNHMNRLRLNDGNDYLSSLFSFLFFFFFFLFFRTM